MARKYSVGFMQRMVNKYVSSAVGKGKLADSMYVLTTVGRKSGQERSIPVTLAERDGQRYLVSPYGNVGWVHNVRASGTAKLERGGNVEEITLTEVDAETAGPVLKQYVEANGTVRPFFEAAKDDPVEDFVAEASRHPVFHIT